MTDHRYRLHVTVNIDSDDEPKIATLLDYARQLSDGLRDSDAFPNLIDAADYGHDVYFIEYGVSPAPSWPTTDADRQDFASWQAEVANGDTLRGFREWAATAVDDT